jgi:hypothetical protein
MPTFDTIEKVDILLKDAFGVTSTDESLPWFAETTEFYNSYVIGENILIDTIPSEPIFNTPVEASSIGLEESDFASYLYNINDIDNCSIVDDSTGVVRRYSYLLLEPTQGTNNDGRSWTKKANGSNVLFNSLAFNYKKTDVLSPYEYKVYKTTGGQSPSQIGPSTGTWSYNTGTGILFFADYEEQGNTPAVSTANPPAMIIYVYIGNRGLSNFTTSSSSSSSSSATTAGSAGSLLKDHTVTTTRGYRFTENEALVSTDIGAVAGFTLNQSRFDSTITGIDLAETISTISDYTGGYKLVTLDSSKNTLLDPSLKQTVTGCTIVGETVTYTGAASIEQNDGVIIPPIDIWNIMRPTVDYNGEEWNKINYNVNTTPGAAGGWNVLGIVSYAYHAFRHNIVDSVDNANNTFTLKFPNSYNLTGTDSLDIEIIKDQSYNVVQPVTFDVPYILENDNLVTENAVQTLTNKTIVFDQGLNVTSGGLKVTSGNVGIGTNNPNHKLEVNGDIKCGDTFIGNVGHTGAGFSHHNYANSTYYALHQDSYGGTFLNCKNNMYLRVGNSTSVVVHGDKRVESYNGIFISGYASTIDYTDAQGDFFTNAPVNRADPPNLNFSLTCSYAAQCTHIVLTSDVRIKENINDIIDDKALQQLRLLAPKTYTYKDKFEKGTNEVIGFIAQEVREVIPRAVTLDSKSIPNILRPATAYTKENNIIELRLGPLFDNTNTDTLTLTSGTKIDIRVNNRTYKTSVLSYSNDIIEIPEEEYMEITDGDKVVVYGEIVDDFHLLDKNAIFTVATAALQEVDRQLQAEKTKVATLETKTATLESQLVDVLARLSALENA